MTELAWVFLLFALFIFLYYLTFGWLLPFLFSSGNEFLCILGILVALFAVIGIVIYLCDKFFGGY